MIPEKHPGAPAARGSRTAIRGAANGGRADRGGADGHSAEDGGGSMIREVRIQSVGDLMPLLTEQEYRRDLDRNRSSYLYRGMPNVDYKMVTSLRRNCKHLQKNLELAILQNFAKYAVREEPLVSRNIWQCMITGQHNGLPTRLLDWSQSPLVGLHFAVTEENLEAMEEHDCMVWRIDMQELYSLLPDRYQTVLSRTQTSIFNIKMMASITENLEQYDRDMKDQSMVIIEPPSTNDRIINQYSFFSIVPTEMDDIEDFLDRRTEHTVKYIIDRHLRWRVRDMLDQLNMSERIIYPGLDGLSKWIARHYYVK